MMRSGFRLLSVMGIVAMVVAGCGGGAANKGENAAAHNQPAAAEAKGATAGAAKASAGEVTIKLGSSDRSSLKNLMFNLKSFGQQQGVKLDFKEYKGGTEIARGLMSGEVDMAVLQTEHVFRDTSGELRMVAMLTDVPANVLVVDSRKEQIRSVKDLVGKKVSVSTIGGGSHQILLAILSKHGIDSSRMNIQPAGQNVAELFKKGDVAAVVSIEPFVTQAIASGIAYPLVDTRKKEGVKEVYGVDSMGWIALATRADYLGKNGPEIERMVKAVQQSLKQITSGSTAELISDSPEYMFPNGDSQLYAKMLEDNRNSFVADGKVTEKLLAPMWADMQAKGAVPKNKSMPFAQVVAAQK